jgi:hypothetical protein
MTTTKSEYMCEMREWDNGNGTVTKGIAFPCKRAGCKREVKVDEQHPQFADLKASPVALCNTCLHKLHGA